MDGAEDAGGAGLSGAKVATGGTLGTGTLLASGDTALPWTFADCTPDAVDVFPEPPNISRPTMRVAAARAATPPMPTKRGAFDGAFVPRSRAPLCDHEADVAGIGS